MKKKIVVLIILIQIMFNFFLNNYTVVYGYKDTSSSNFSDMQLDYNQYQQGIENGTATVGNNGNKSTIASKSVITMIGTTILKFLNIFPTTIRLFLTVLTQDSSDTYGKEFTIQKTIFNDIEIFNINYFSVSEAKGAMSYLRKNVSIFFVFLRDIAVIFSLIILIYAGIRMAISTMANEKAKFKKVLMDWLFSFLLLMSIQYIMSIIIFLVESLDSLLVTLYMNISGVTDLEDQILEQVIFTWKATISYIIPCILYWVLILYQLKFALMYMKRVFSIGFLIVISPIVISSYSLDKAKDGEAQALKVWLKEFLVNVLVQPMHILLYTIFFVTAENIVQTAPILSIIFIMAMTRGEKVLRNIFRFGKPTSLGSMEDSPASFENIKKLAKGGK